MVRKFPRAGLELSTRCRSITTALLRRKVTPQGAAPATRSQGDLKAVKRIFETIESKDDRYELNLYIAGYDEDDGGATAGRPRPSASRRRAGPRRGPHPMKVAYWPGCVSRGFTPELHGSMAKVAPLLDLELVELDRASCCGAGVIAEHNQELADTLNARTFALAQQSDGAELMMNICSTCQGAQTECQERLDANAEYRDHVNEHPRAEGLTLREGPDQQEPPLAAGRGDRPRRAARRGSSGR